MRFVASPAGTRRAGFSVGAPGGRRRLSRDCHEINPLGVKGVGEIGIVGTAAAVANAVYHATGKRVRDLPITLDKLMRA